MTTHTLAAKPHNPVIKMQVVTLSEFAAIICTCLLFKNHFVPDKTIDKRVQGLL